MAGAGNGNRVGINVVEDAVSRLSAVSERTPLLMEDGDGLDDYSDASMSRSASFNSITSDEDEITPGAYRSLEARPDSNRSSGRSSLAGSPSPSRSQTLGPGWRKPPGERSPEDKRNRHREVGGRRKKKKKMIKADRTKLVPTKKKLTSPEVAPQRAEPSSPLHHRMRYYSRLSQQAGNETPILEPPRHVLTGVAPYALWDAKGKQGDLATIFSIWNCMFGSGALVIPWGFANAGLATGVGTIMFFAALTCYTAYLILSNSGGFDDFPDMCRYYIGPWAYYLATFASVAILFVVSMAYTIMMSDFLHSVICSITYWTNGTGLDNNCSPPIDYLPVLIIGLLFPLINVNALGLIVKFNSVGVFSIVFMLGFIISESVGVASLDWSQVEEFKPTSYYLIGVVYVSFFIHNALIPIAGSQANPEHKVRNLGIAFGLVAASYMLVGVVSYLAFVNSGAKSMPQNYLDLFPVNHVGAFMARTVIFIQLVTLVPLLLFIIRLQLFGAIFKTDERPFSNKLILNVVLAGGIISVATWYPFIGTLLRFGGGFSGAVYVFIMPVLVHYKARVKEGKKPSPLWLAGHGAILLVGLAGGIMQFV